MDVAGHPVQVTGQEVAHVLLEHVQRAPPVQAENNVVHTVRDHVAWRDRRASLAQSRRHLHLGREKYSRKAAAGNLFGHVLAFHPRRRQAADQEARGGQGQLLDQTEAVGIARVDVNDAEPGRDPRHPFPVTGGQFVGPLAYGGDHGKAVVGQVRRHDRHRRTVEIFLRVRADAHADAADPVLYPGLSLEVRKDTAQVFGQGLGDVHEPQVGLDRRRAQPVGAGLGGMGPVVGRGMGDPERSHGDRSLRSLCCRLGARTAPDSIIGGAAPGPHQKNARRRDGTAFAKESPGSMDAPSAGLKVTES